MAVRRELADRLTPPKRPRSPREHYEIADTLLKEIEDLERHELSLGYAKAKLARAQIHAMLAQYSPSEDLVENEPSMESLGLRKTCVHCLVPIVLTPNDEWIHELSGRIECRRDPKLTEIATP